jgi:hypothetical protein
VRDERTFKGLRYTCAPMSTADLAEQHSSAMAEHLNHRSTAIVIHDASDAPISVGSGTCVRIADRHLIATAAHVLDEVKTLRDVGVMAHGPVGPSWNRETSQGTADEGIDRSCREALRSAGTAMTSDGRTPRSGVRTGWRRRESTSGARRLCEVHPRR